MRHVGAHSDGDSVVLFRKADVIATGDILDLRHFPVIDRAQGGSIQGELAALNRLLELTVPAMPLVLKPGRTLLVPGHGRVSDYAELVEYRDMVTTIKDNIEVLIKDGKTLAQVQAANPTAGYRARWGRGDGAVDDGAVCRGDLYRAHGSGGEMIGARTASRRSQSEPQGPRHSAASVACRAAWHPASACGSATDRAAARCAVRERPQARPRRPTRGAGHAPHGRPIDLTGQWVAIISEDWRWRMVTPGRGDYASIPMSPAAQKVADAWDPAKDEAAGEQCRAYGAPGLMRGPTRLRSRGSMTRRSSSRSDYGMQTRLFRFGRTPTRRRAPRPGRASRPPSGNIAGGGRGRGPRFGSLKTVTTQLRPGYLRKNGVPYSAGTVFTEHWDVHTETNGDRYLVGHQCRQRPPLSAGPVHDGPTLQLEKDGAAKWDPTPCDARF